MLNHRKFIRSSFNRKGLSIIEVLIAAGLTAIVSLGIATMMQNAAVEQKKITLLSNLKEIKNRIEFLVRDPNSWSQTINVTTGTHNSNANTFGAMRGQDPLDFATTGALTNPEKIILFDASGNIAMNLLGPTDTTGNGFTESGAACTGFDATAGNDRCPISYRLLVGYRCADGTTSCTTPLVRVVGRLVFSPSSTGTLRRFDNLIAQIGGADISNPASVGKYDAYVERTPTQGNRSFTLAVQVVPGGATGADCATKGIGTCTTAMSAHPTITARGWTGIAGDVTSMVTIVAGGGVQFREPGAYSCAVSVPAFATGGFTAELYNQTQTQVVGTASTVAGMWSQTTALVDTKFNVSTAGISDVYIVRQRCDAIPSGTPAPANCSLGIIPQSAYYDPLFNAVTLSCYKFDTM